MNLNFKISPWLRVLLCVFALAQSGSAPAAALTNAVERSEWWARTWQTDEGLPDNNISGIVQSADGFLWVATFGGLMRFDGAHFEEFSAAHLPGIPSRGIRLLAQGRNGRLWLGMDRGVLIRADDREARVFTERDGLSRGRVVAMAEDQSGVLWVFSGSGISRIFGEKAETVGAESGMPQAASTWLTVDERGQLWVARGSRVGVLRDERWLEMQSFEAGPLRLFPARGGGVWVSCGAQLVKCVEGSAPQAGGRLPDGATVRVAVEDRDGVLWVGTAADGLWRLERGEFKAVSVPHPEISALLEDREGNLWVGTAGGGLSLLRPQALELVATKSGLPFESVRSVCEDSEGWMWTALQNGSLARGRGTDWSTVTSADGWTEGDAVCVSPALGGGVWIGTRDRGLQRLRGGQCQEWSDRDDPGSRRVRSVLATSNGDVWISTDSPSQLRVLHGGKFSVPEMPGQVRSIRALAEAPDGSVWAGTSDGQVLRVADGKVELRHTSWDEAPQSVRCLHFSPDGSLLIGYAGWGVGWWHSGKYSRLTAAMGLYDDFVTQMLSDAQGRLWITGNRGLYQVRMDELAAVAEGRKPRLRSISFGRNEGLSSLQPVCENSPSAWRSADGRLWFSTRNGLLVVAPAKIRDNPSPPPVLLTRVRVDDQLVALRDSHSPLHSGVESQVADLRTPGLSLELAPGHGKLEFEFTALSFRSPENVHFRHRLKGFDTDWIDIGPQRSAKYPRLTAGDYEFQVLACNEAGVWSETCASAAFVVRPFFWQAWWFRTGALLLFTGGVIGAARYFSFRRLRRELDSLERQAALQRERTRIARDMHDEVGAKLSRLSLLSEMASQQPHMPPAARGEVAEISETARETIRSFEEIVWAVNPKNDSLADLINYLCRFTEEQFDGSPVQCGFDLPAQIPEMELSTDARHHVFLAAKEALNNVLKHASAKQVTVQLRVTATELEIAIADDGCGFASCATAGRLGGGNGLENMRERMRSIGGRLELHTQPGEGTNVAFHFPCPVPKRK